MYPRPIRALAHIFGLAAAVSLTAIGGPQARMAYFDLLNQGGERYEAGDYEGAVESYRAAAALNLSSLAPRIRLARALNRLGRHEEAAALLERTARYGAEHVDLRAARAEALLGMGEPGLAIEQIEPVIRANPAAAPPLRLRGQARLMLGRDAEGLADLEEAVRLAPGDPDGAQALSRYYLDRRQPEKALLILARLRRAAGGDPRTSAALAEAEGALGDPHAAAAELLTRVSARSRDALARLYASQPVAPACPEAPASADELLACGRFGAARALLESRAADGAPDELRLARACLWLGDRACAAAALRRAALLEPARAGGMERLATALEGGK